MDDVKRHLEMPAMPMSSEVLGYYVREIRKNVVDGEDYSQNIEPLNISLKPFLATI